MIPRDIARILAGDVVAGGVVFPAPGHSAADRSASVRFDPQAPGGFVVNSFAGDDPLPIKDHVRVRLGLAGVQAKALASTAFRTTRAGQGSDDANRSARASALWDEAQDPHGSPVWPYLAGRGLTLPAEAAGEAIRWHPRCWFAGERTGAMVALVRSIEGNKPVAIHRTALSLDGRKVEVEGKGRLALGPVRGGAVKLTPDEDVTLALGIGEGIETALSLRELPEFGSSPVWSLLSTAGVAAFPVLTGIEALWIAVDHDPAGERAARTCADRWRAEGREVYLVRPRAQRADLNDMVKGRSRHAG